MTWQARFMDCIGRCPEQGVAAPRGSSLLQHNMWSRGWNEFLHGLAQRAFTKEDHLIQAGFLDAPDEPFGIRVGMSLQMRRMATLKVDVSE